MASKIKQLFRRVGLARRVVSQDPTGADADDFGQGSGSGGGLPNPANNTVPPTAGAIPNLPGSLGAFGETNVANPNPDGWMFKDMARNSESLYPFDQDGGTQHPFDYSTQASSAFLYRVGLIGIDTFALSKVSDYITIAFYARGYPMSAPTDPSTREVFAVKYDIDPATDQYSRTSWAAATMPVGVEGQRKATFGEYYFEVSIDTPRITRFHFGTQTIEHQNISADDWRIPCKALAPVEVAAWDEGGTNVRDYSIAASSPDNCFATFQLRLTDPLGVEPSWSGLFGALYKRSVGGDWSVTYTLLHGGYDTGSFHCSSGGTNLIYAPTNNVYLIFSCDASRPDTRNLGAVYQVNPTTGALIQRVEVSTHEEGGDSLSPIRVHTWGGVEHGCVASTSWRSNDNDDKLWITTFHFADGLIVVDQMAQRPPGVLNKVDYEYESIIFPDWDSEIPRWTVWTQYERTPYRWVEFCVTPSTGVILGSTSFLPAVSEDERYLLELNGYREPFYLIKHGKKTNLLRLSRAISTTQVPPLVLLPRSTLLSPSPDTAMAVNKPGNNGSKVVGPTYFGHALTMSASGEDHLFVTQQHMAMCHYLYVDTAGKAVASIDADYYSFTDELAGGPGSGALITLTLGGPGTHPALTGSMVQPTSWGGEPPPAFLTSVPTATQTRWEVRRRGNTLSLGDNTRAAKFAAGHGLSYGDQRAVKYNASRELVVAVPSADLADCWPIGIATPHPNFYAADYALWRGEGDTLFDMFGDLVIAVGKSVYVQANGSLGPNMHAVSGAWQFRLGVMGQKISVLPFKL